MEVTIDIRDQATANLREFEAALSSDGLNQAVGRAVVNRIQKHLFDYNATHPNALGGKRTNFYSGAAKGTHYQLSREGVRVSVNQLGIRQRLEGGTIKPVNAKYLTIPAIAEAYGRRAGEFNNLHVVYNAQRRPVGLAEAPATNLKRTKKGFKGAGETQGRVFFWFAKSVRQEGDASVMPTNEEITAAALGAVNDFVGRLIRRQQGGGGARA